MKNPLCVAMQGGFWLFRFLFVEVIADLFEDFEGLLFDGWLGWGFFLSWGFFAWFQLLQVVEEAHD